MELCYALSVFLDVLCLLLGVAGFIGMRHGLVR